MLSTIKLPRNLKYLNKGLLPKSNYIQEEDEEEEHDTMYTDKPVHEKKNNVEYELKVPNYESDA